MRVSRQEGPSGVPTPAMRTSPQSRRICYDLKGTPYPSGIESEGCYEGMEPFWERPPEGGPTFWNVDRNYTFKLGQWLKGLDGMSAYRITDAWPDSCGTIWYVTYHKYIQNHLNPKYYRYTQRVEHDGFGPIQVTDEMSMVTTPYINPQQFWG